MPGIKIPCGKDGFDCAFEIRKDLTGKPSRGRIDIFNLTQDHRDQLSEKAAKGPIRVTLEAGYEDGVSQIYQGDLRILYHDRDNGTDFVTRLESGDGDRIINSARISKSWGPGTPISTVIKDLAGALGIGEGNVRAATAGALLEGIGPTFPGGTAASGSAYKELVRICRSSGILFSIQDGTLQFLVEARALSGTAIKLTSGTGMENVAKIDHKGRLHVTSRIIPGLFPGRKIQLENGTTWRVDKARYHGQTRGQAWNIFLEAKPV